MDDPPSPPSHLRHDRLAHLRRRRVLPRSRVRGPSTSNFSIAATMASCAARPAMPPRSMKSSISAADQIKATGLAMFWPWMPGARPCTSSKRKGNMRSGSGVALARRPSPRTATGTMQAMSELTFRRLARADFPLLRAWLARPHVARWWNHGTSPQAVEADFGAAVDGTDPTDIFIVLAEGRPIGLVQRYLFADNPDYMAELAPLVATPGEALSIDYFVGEPEALGSGLGTAMIRASVTAVWRDHPSAPAVIVPVNAANEASWRTLERAGFERVAEGPLEPDNPIDDRSHHVYRIDRPIDAGPADHGADDRA